MHNLQFYCRIKREKQKRPNLEILLVETFLPFLTKNQTSNFCCQAVRSTECRGRLTWIRHDGKLPSLDWSRLQSKWGSPLIHDIEIPITSIPDLLLSDLTNFTGVSSSLSVLSDKQSKTIYKPTLFVCVLNLMKKLTLFSIKSDDCLRVSVPYDFLHLPN